MTDLDERLALLSPAVSELLREAIRLSSDDDAQYHEVDQAWSAALRSVGFIRSSNLRDPLRPIQLASELGPEQRAFVEVLALMPGLPLLGSWPIYVASWLRRRWLGLEPGGALFEEIDVEVDGQTLRWPFLHALRRMLQKGEEGEAVARAMVSGLPIDSRIEVLVELAMARDDVAFSGLYELVEQAALEVGDEAGETAKRMADWLLALYEDPAATRDRAAGQSPPELVAMLVFAAMVGARVPIEPRYDALLRLSSGDSAELSRKCVAAVPQERREAALVAAMGHLMFPRNRVRMGLILLPDFAYPGLLQIVLDSLDRVDDPNAELKKLEKISNEHPSLAPLVAARRGAMPEVPELWVDEIIEPVTLEALDDVRRRQLEIAGRLYGGQELSAEEILANDDEEDERIHRDFLEYRKVVDAQGKPAYDVWLYMVDSGTIFEAGTEKVVGEVIQCGLETDDPVVRLALPPVLSSKPNTRR